MLEKCRAGVYQTGSTFVQVDTDLFVLAAVRQKLVLDKVNLKVEFKNINFCKLQSLDNDNGESINYPSHVHV